MMRGQAAVRMDVGAESSSERSCTRRMQGHIRDRGQRRGRSKCLAQRCGGQYRPNSRRWEDERTDQEPDEGHQGSGLPGPRTEGLQDGGVYGTRVLLTFSSEMKTHF